MTPEEVKSKLAWLHIMHGITKMADVPLTVPGKGHWLYDKWMPAYADFPQEGGYHDKEAKFHGKNW